MATIRDCAKEYLLTRIFNTVTGNNNKSIQYQGVENRKMIFGLYDEDGDHDGETTDLEAALDYIALKQNSSCDSVHQAYKLLSECCEGDESSAILNARMLLEEAMG